MESSPVNEKPSRSRIEVVAAVSLLLVILAGALIARRAEAPASKELEGARIIPADSARILVEVINTTTQRGLARQAMFFLRDRGFDVVRYASGSPPRDSTQVIDRTGNRERATLVAKALGVSSVAVVIDSTRYLDVTVLLGRDWRPPAKPFYP
ncbi:MAG TPA: LytR C-terminal domain-containing protein [Gemmatimonadaceae bacterium]|nr:LytR C-terminal domain-containing protein [Gemmatimonadaceae bacterium]